VRCHLAQPPQGRKAARVGGLCQVRGGSLRGLSLMLEHRSAVPGVGVKVGPCRWPSTAPIGQRGWPTWWARNTSPRLWRELWTTIAFTTRTFSPAPAAVAKRRQLESWRDR